MISLQNYQFPVRLIGRYEVTWNIKYFDHKAYELVRSFYANPLLTIYQYPDKPHFQGVITLYTI